MSELRPYSCHERRLADLVTDAGVTEGALAATTAPLFTVTALATCADVGLAAVRSVLALTGSSVGVCADNPVYSKIYTTALAIVYSTGRHDLAYLW